MSATPAATESASRGTPEYRSELWRMADALRGSMDAAEYEHVVLGLISLCCAGSQVERKREGALAGGLDRWTPGGIADLRWSGTGSRPFTQVSLCLAPRVLVR